MFSVGDKSGWESATVLSGAVLVLLSYLQGEGVVPGGVVEETRGAGEAIISLLQHVATLGGIFGARRAIGNLKPAKSGARR